MVSDSISCSLAVSLTVSLAVLLPLSLVYLHLAESFTEFLVGALVVYQLFSDHVGIWLCLPVSLALQCPSISQLYGTVSLGFCLAVLGSASGQCLCCVSGCTSDSGSG